MKHNFILLRVSNEFDQFVTWGKSAGNGSLFGIENRVAILFQFSVDNTDSHPYICALFYGILTPSLKGWRCFMVFRPGYPALNRNSFSKKIVLVS